MKTRVAMKLALCAGIIAVLTAFWIGLVQPVQAWKNKQLAALDGSQEKSATMVSRLRALSQQASAISSDVEFNDIWIASSPGEATARVQATLSGLARQSGITFRAITPIQPDALPLMSAVKFRVEAEAPLDHLVSFLRSAEHASPVLVFEKAALRRLSKASSVEGQPQIFFQFDIMAAYELIEDG